MEVLNEFKTQLILFFDELIDQFPEEGDLVVARLFISNQVCIDDLMNDFNHHINKDDQCLKKMIKERREDFFLEHNLFDSHRDSLNHFKKIWRSGHLDKEDKKVIWSWVDTFVFLSDKYAREKSLVLNQAN
jgi:hypothetical protein